MLRLKVLINGKEDVHEFKDTPVVIGSHEKADLFLPYEGVAEEHIALKPAGKNSWILKALGGKKVLVNQDLLDEAIIKEGDTIEVSGIKIFVEKAKNTSFLSKRKRPRKKGSNVKLEVVGLIILIIGAYIGYKFYGNPSPIAPIEILEAHTALKTWKFNEARRYLELAKSKYPKRIWIDLDMELKEREKAWDEATKLYNRVWAKRKKLSYWEMSKELNLLIGEAYRKNKKFVADALKHRVANLRVALLEDLGDPSGERAARALKWEKDRISVIEVIDKADELIKEGKIRAALDLVEQAKGETKSPAAREDYEAKKRGILVDMAKLTLETIYKAYTLANIGKAKEALAVLEKQKKLFTPDGDLGKFYWKLERAEQEIRPLISDLADIFERKPRKTKKKIPTIDWKTIEKEKYKQEKDAKKTAIKPKEKELNLAKGPSYYFKQAEKADREWRFNEAAELYANVAEIYPKARERARFARAKARFIESMVNLIKKHPGSFKNIRLEDGGVADFVDADINGVKGTVDGVASFLKWNEIGPFVIISIAQKFNFDGESRLGLAALALESGLYEKFDRIILSALKVYPNIKKDAEKLIEKRTGKKGPFVWFRKKWVPEKEKALMLRSETALIAVNKALNEKNLEKMGEILENIAKKGEVELVAVKDALEKRIYSVTKEILKNPFFRKVKRIEKLRKELDKKRKHALDLIFDTKTYFYPFKPPACPPEKAKLYPPVQMEVDKRVEAVKKIWNNPLKIKIPNEIISKTKMVLFLIRIYEDLGGYGQKMLDALDPVRRLPLKEKVLTIKNFAWDVNERKELDFSQRIMRYNMVVDVDATKEEMIQMNITNEYRLMMGRRALAINPKIYRAARGHSEEMNKLGYFSHFSPNKERRTPFMRMALEGYHMGVSENIALAGGPVHAHQLWLHSSNHHRNILSPGHTEFATGNSGKYWTQNFGQGNEFLKDPLFEKE